MSDIVVNVFHLSNNRGYTVPPLNFTYEERSTGHEWRVTCGGTRGYFVRIGDKLDSELYEQAADSHFMADRIVCALLLGQAGSLVPRRWGEYSYKELVEILLGRRT